MSSSSSSASATAAASAAAAAPAHLVLPSPRPCSARHHLQPIANRGPPLALTTEGPSCLYVGPVKTASKEMLEALYQQARDSYYSGYPLIADDMFDKIEEHPSQVFALATIWLLLLAFGSSAILVPAIYVCSLAFADAINSGYYLYPEISVFGSFTTVSKSITLGLGYLVGYPLAYASIQALKGLWRNELVAMKGSCPNCGEEVFTFVKPENST